MASTHGFGPITRDSSIRSKIEDSDPGTKRFKRFRSRRQQLRDTFSRTGTCLSLNDEARIGSTFYKRDTEDSLIQDAEVKELIFLRDLHFGFLPDDCEVEFMDCFLKISKDENFAWKCLKLALMSRNEDLVRGLLENLHVTRKNFDVINSTFVDSLVLEAVEVDDLESIEGILSWRDMKAKEIGLTEVDKRLLMMQKKAQEVIMTAAIRNNYSIVKLLFADGYRIFEKLADDRFFFTQDAEYFDTDDVMERHIDRIRVFKAISSPAYMSLTYEDNPVDHSFDYSKKAALGMRREPEFRSDFEQAQLKCRIFAVSLLDSCRNSSEVELVLDGSPCDSPIKKKSNFKRLYRALSEDQKEFVAHSYCQLLLYHRWTSGLMWSSKNFLEKTFHIVFLCSMSPLLCLLYAGSPYRDHREMKHIPVLTWMLRQLDCPINRFILDVNSYILFLAYLLLSVVQITSSPIQFEKALSGTVINLWVFCFCARTARTIIQFFRGKNISIPVRFGYDCINLVFFVLALGFKKFGSEPYPTPEDICSQKVTWNPDRYSTIGANLFGVAACLAFLRLIFVFEIHNRFGPILFCIKQVFWDIISVIGSYLIIVCAFAVGLKIPFNLSILLKLFQNNIKYHYGFQIIVCAFAVGLVSIFGIFKERAKFSGFETSFKTLFWILFDPGQEEYVDILKTSWPAEITKWNRTLNYTIHCNQLRNMNITRLSQVDDGASNPYVENDISHNIGIYVWGSYQVLVVIIMMNLLISLMTTTFARIQSNADVEWKFTRASIWIHYYDDWHALPIPFNILPSAYNLRLFINWMNCDGKKTEKKSWKKEQQIEREAKRRYYDLLVERVFRRQEKQQESSVKRVDIEALEKEICIDIAELRRDVRALRKDMNLTTSVSFDRSSEKFGPKSEEDFDDEEEEPVRMRRHDNNDPEGKSSELRKSYRKSCLVESFKTDNNPELVEHLAQTLGLIGVEGRKGRPLKHSRVSFTKKALDRSFSSS